MLNRILTSIPESIKPIALALAALLVMIIINLMIEPLLVIRLTHAGTSASQIGIFGSCFWLGILGMSPWIPSLIKRFGLKLIYSIAGILPLITLPIFWMQPNILLWSICNLALGSGASFRWVITESLIAQSAPSEKRGQYIGFYQTLIALCFVIGPLLLSLIIKFYGAQSDIPFIIAAVGFSICFLSLYTMPAPKSDTEKPINKQFIPELIKKYVLIIIAAFLGGLYESGPSGFLAFIGLKHHFPSEWASALVMVIGIGSFLIQAPIGMLADRFALPKLLITCNLMILTGSLILLFVNLHAQHAQFAPLLFLIALLWGGAGGAIYTLCIIYIGGLFKDLELITATGVIIFTFNIGTTLGPTVTGLLYDFSPQYGITSMLCLLTTTAIISFWQMRHHLQRMPSNVT